MSTPTSASIDFRAAEATARAAVDVAAGVVRSPDSLINYRGLRSASDALHHVARRIEIQLSAARGAHGEVAAFVRALEALHAHPSWPTVDPLEDRTSTHDARARPRWSFRAVLDSLVTALTDGPPPGFVNNPLFAFDALVRLHEFGALEETFDARDALAGDLWLLESTESGDAERSALSIGLIPHGVLRARTPIAVGSTVAVCVADPDRASDEVVDSIVQSRMFIRWWRDRWTRGQSSTEASLLPASPAIGTDLLREARRGGDTDSAWAQRRLVASTPVGPVWAEAQLDLAIRDWEVSDYAIALARALEVRSAEERLIPRRVRMAAMVVAGMALDSLGAAVDEPAIEAAALALDETGDRYHAALGWSIVADRANARADQPVAARTAQRAQDAWQGCGRGKAAARFSQRLAVEAIARGDHGRARALLETATRNLEGERTNPELVRQKRELAALLERLDADKPR